MSDTRVLASGDAAESVLSNTESIYRDEKSYWEALREDMDPAQYSEFMEFIQEYDSELEEYNRIVALEFIKRIFLTITMRDHPIISMLAFLHCWGVSEVTVQSMEETGERLGITKQAVSKEVTYFRDRLQTRSLGNAKSEEARETYREVQNRRYAEIATTEEKNHGASFSDLYGE